MCANIYIPSSPFEFQNDFPQVEFSQVPGEFRRVSDFHARLRFLEVAERRPPRRPRILFPFLKLARSRPYCSLFAASGRFLFSFYFPLVISYTRSVPRPSTDEYVYDDGKVGSLKGLYSSNLFAHRYKPLSNRVTRPAHTSFLADLPS